jgi:hypothetical protein
MVKRSRMACAVECLSSHGMVRDVISDSVKQTERELTFRLRRYAVLTYALVKRMQSWGPPGEDVCFSAQGENLVVAFGGAKDPARVKAAEALKKEPNRTAPLHPLETMVPAAHMKRVLTLVSLMVKTLPIQSPPTYRVDVPGRVVVVGMVDQLWAGEMAGLANHAEVCSLEFYAKAGNVGVELTILCLDSAS